MDITKALGVDYIWIDSLCIVQNDDDDWRKEASLMSSVYGGSYVNIAASSATNAHQGCHTKVNGLVDGLQVKVHISGQVDGHKLIQFEEGALYHAALWQTPLASRAWAFQEKILSPRTIHFGDRGVYWECANKIASECLPCGLVLATPTSRPFESIEVCIIMSIQIGGLVLSDYTRPLR